MSRDPRAQASPRRFSPGFLILAATAVSGASGYFVTGLVAASVDVVEYTTFAVFWSALFLVVGGLGGLQHELARASGPLIDDRLLPRSVARVSRFSIVFAAVVTVVLASSAPLWGPPLLGSAALVGAAALMAGALGYVLVAASCGVMYGLALWRPLAIMISLDGVLRLALVGLGLALDAPVETLVWAVALPFVVTVIVVLPFVAAPMRRSTLDVGYRGLTANTGRTIVAAAATATIIAGFPVLLRASDPVAPESVIAPLILVLTLTRAPLVIPMMAMQSYLVVRFKARPGDLFRRVMNIAAAVLLAAAALAGLLGLVGPWLFVALFGPEYNLDGIVIAGLVASSGLVAALAVTSPALLSRSQHGAVTAGWLVAVGGLLVVLFVLPMPLVDRALLALAAGPLLGLVVHVVALLFPAATQAAAIAGRPTSKIDEASSALHPHGPTRKAKT
jgi:hypothetical protein